MMEVKQAIDFILDKLRAELSENLIYHSVSHTIGVIDATINIAKSESIEGRDLDLLMVAAAYHDSGFLRGNQNHEVNSCALLSEYAPDFGFDSEEIDQMKSMIMSTKIPQSPVTKLEKVLCDADLDYLGGKRYNEISEKLYQEFQLNGVEMSQEDWLDMQIGFLISHTYWTEFSQNKRSAGKERVLNNLKKQTTANRV